MITIKNLTFRYPKAKVDVLNNINFNINKGEIFGFLGPSGAGKSTIQKIMIGLLKEFTGDVKVLGKPIQNWNRDLYQHIGIQPELPNHFKKLTARENLNYFATLYKKGEPIYSAEELLAKVNLLDAADLKISEFSKGMKQRLSLARALIHKPEVLFLDEPTSGLDPVSSQMVKDILFELKQNGSTIIMNTHNMAIADQVCDRVAFIVDGHVSTIEKPHELKIKHGSAALIVEYVNEHEIKFEEFSMVGLSDNTKFQTILKDLEVRTLHSREASLEDVFIKLTGRTLV
ncbi:ABC transporter ATP-binding protein [Marinicellulosiphila megalodicopiae]|uniref:ABC transporter ATP-binding protein n=1 Tax=Marinicellulosiphila megalodicopiae TaxID=2724896 RepID=UPI003BAE90B7